MYLALSKQMRKLYWDIAMLPVTDEEIKMFDYYIFCNIYESKGEVMNDQQAETATRFLEAYMCIVLKWEAFLYRLFQTDGKELYTNCAYLWHSWNIRLNCLSLYIEKY